MYGNHTWPFNFFLIGTLLVEFAKQEEDSDTLEDVFVGIKIPTDIKISDLGWSILSVQI